MGYAWVLTGERCPKCGDRMIRNNKYEECGALHCTYIKAFIKDEAYAGKPLDPNEVTFLDNFHISGNKNDTNK